MSFDLVLFGGTGDLAWRKLMPALFQAFRHGKLPAGGRILAVARDERSDDDYRAFVKERFDDVEVAKRPSDEEFARFAGLLHYRRMDLSQPERLRRPEALARHEPRGADTVGAVPRHQPAPVPGDLRAARRGRAERPARPRRAREAARPRPGRARRRSTASCARVFSETAGLPHRPLPRQAVGAEPDGAALRQRAVRAAVAAREHRQHPDHAGRGPRRGHARRLLRPAPARCAT